ncbi:calmodulin-dependent protein kinase [Aureococcus anophagefferens]|nr:calmodulin-dependent protein kinase [Aureococcus anophagefferens]
MSARFHRFADFAPDDVEWWQGEAGLLESYVGEWLPAVVRVRQGRVRVEAPVTGAESAVRVLRDFRIGGACAARADGWRLFGGGFAAAVVAADAAAHLRFPAAAARDAFVAAGVVRLVAGEDGARRAGKALPFRTSKEKRVACREFELMRRVGRECATAHVVRLLEAFECDAGGPKCVLVLELCSGGDLYSRIVERGTYSEAACAGAVRQVLGGLGALEAEAEPAADEPATEAEALEAEAADEAAEPEPEGAEAAGAEAEAVGAEPESEAAPEPDADAADAAADSEAEPERPDADADADADAALDEPAPEYEQTVELDGGGEDYDAYGDDYDFRDDYGDGDYGSNSFAGLDDEDFPDDEYGDIPDDSYEPADPRLDVDGHADPDKGYVSAAQKKALKKLEGALRDLEEEQRRKERRLDKARDALGDDDRYGRDSALWPLRETCISKKFSGYKYEVCFFKGAKQGSTRLGDYQRSTKHANNVTATLVYEHGEHCWNGPSQSLAVTLVCGAETGILDVDEPSTCVYAATVETPAVCVDADAPDVDCAGYKPAFALFDGLDSPKKRKKGARKLLKKAKAALASFFGRD